MRDSSATGLGKAQLEIAWSSLRFVTQLRQTYLLCESRDGIYLLDQHAVGVFHSAQAENLLALGSGYGSELRRPLGISMVGGLLLSQVLTLYTTPVIYIFFDKLGRRFSRAGNRSISPEAPREPGAVPSA